jgi:hypothetical protein
MLAFTGDGHDAGLDVVRACNDLDVELDIVPRLFEVVGSKAQFHSLQGTPLLGLSPPVLSTSHRIAKRAIDILGATFGLIVLFPLLAVVAISIKLNSKGRCCFARSGSAAASSRSRSSSSARWWPTPRTASPRWPT